VLVVHQEVTAERAVRGEEHRIDSAPRPGERATLPDDGGATVVTGAEPETPALENPEPARPVAGARFLRPVPVAAVVVLALNDHVFKQAWPGFVTGKLSDLAGMVFFPFFLEGLWESGLALARAIRKSRAPWRREGRRLFACALATGLVFSAVKTVPLANEAYRVGLGGLQWGLRAVFAAAVHAPAPPFHRVSLVRDPTDLLGLVGLAWPLLAARRATREALQKNGTKRAII
jgi:hypothetical protein